MKCVAGVLSALVWLKRAIDVPLFSTTVTVFLPLFLSKADLVLKEEEGSEDAVAAKSGHFKQELISLTGQTELVTATGWLDMLIFRNRCLRLTATLSFL